MDKREEIIELLARGLSHNLRYDMLADKILSITNRIKSNDNPFCNNCKETDCEVSHDETCNMIRKYLSIRVKCPECDNGVINAEEFSNNDVPIMSDCPSCKDGWIYPDPQKMYEALLKLDKWMDASLPHFKLDAKGIIKQAIKGEL